MESASRRPSRCVVVAQRVRRRGGREPARRRGALLHRGTSRPMFLVLTPIFCSSISVSHPRVHLYPIFLAHTLFHILKPALLSSCAGPGRKAEAQPGPFRGRPRGHEDGVLPGYGVRTRNVVLPLDSGFPDRVPFLISLPPAPPLAEPPRLAGDPDLLPRQ